MGLLEFIWQFLKQTNLLIVKYALKVIENTNNFGVFRDFEFYFMIF